MVVARGEVLVLNDATLLKIRVQNLRTPPRPEVCGASILRKNNEKTVKNRDG
jgi:hypothetical protein